MMAFSFQSMERSIFPGEVQLNEVYKFTEAPGGETFIFLHSHTRMNFFCFILTVKKGDPHPNVISLEFCLNFRLK